MTTKETETTSFFTKKITYKPTSLNFFLRLFRFIVRHLFRNGFYLITYSFCYFLKDFYIKISFYDFNDLPTLLTEGKSIIRFGDGEVFIMNFGSIHYQKYHPDLRAKFFAMVKEYTNTSPYVLGLNQGGVTKSNAYLRSVNYLNLWLPSKVVYFLHYNKKAKYIDNGIFYYRNIFVEKVLPYLRDKHVIVVTRKGTIDYIQKENKQNNFIETVSFVETPDFQSFEKYKEIKDSIYQAIKISSKKPILLVAMGPATKALVYDFSKEGIQGIDVGIGLEFVFSKTGKEDMLLPVT